MWKCLQMSYIIENADGQCPGVCTPPSLKHMVLWQTRRSLCTAMIQHFLGDGIGIEYE